MNRNKKKIKRLIMLPNLVISLVICVSGLRWLISQEPWILDQVANEERLAMTFNKLFSIKGNNTLAAYLKQIYSCLLYTSPSPRDQRGSRMPSSA